MIRKKSRYNVPQLTKQTTVGDLDIDINYSFEDMASKYRDRQNKWMFYMYPRTIYNNDTSQPIDKHLIKGLEPRQIMEMHDDDTNLEGRYGANYVGHVVTYIYSQLEMQMMFKLGTIGKGCFYFNDERIQDIPSWSWTDTIEPMTIKKGWNKVELLFVADTGMNGFKVHANNAWNGIYKSHSLITQYSCDFPESTDTDIVNTEEHEIHSLSIKGKTNFNILGEDLWDEAYQLHDEALKLDDKGNPYWTRTKGDKGLRFRMDCDEAITGTMWHWRNVSVIKPGIRTAIFKPLTKYTLTYIVHEAFRPEGGQYEVNIWVADSRWSLKLEPGTHTLTFTTDSKADKGTAYLLRELYAGPQTIYNKGDRRVYDVELISLIEGDKGQMEKTNTLYSVGTNDGFTMFVQDCNPVLGEYVLQADIPKKIQNIEEDIESNIDIFEVTWI